MLHNNVIVFYQSSAYFYALFKSGFIILTKAKICLEHDLKKGLYNLQKKKIL